MCLGIRQKTLSIVNKKNDPFIEMVELAEQAQLEEAQRNLLSTDHVLNAANLIPVNTIINSQLIVEGKTYPLNKKKCKGYFKIIDKEKNVSFKKVYYYEYYRKRNYKV